MKYLSFTCKMTFSEPIKFSINPLFLVRSILGNSLRRESCTYQGVKCNECTDQLSCLYYKVFEGVMAKNEDAGMKVHPFSLHAVDIQDLNREISEFYFKVTLYGEDISSIYPYLYVAFAKAGEAGILKKRIPFSFKVVKVGQSETVANISLKNAIENWSENVEDYQGFKGQVRISTITPLRFKFKGHYGLDFTNIDLFSCLTRRMCAILSTYGECEEGREYYFNKNIEIVKKDLKWVDYGHYSARQKDLIQLGGVMGDIVLDGEFSPQDMMILDFAERFSVGKSVVFGLGCIELWKKEER